MTRESTEAPMTLEAFEAALDRWGESLETWPEVEQSRARALLRESPDAERLLERQGELSLMLTHSPDAEVPARLRARIAEVPLRFPHATGWRALWPFDSLWRPLAGFALAAALGLWVGVVDDPIEGDVEAWDELSALTLATDYDAEELEP